VPITTLDPNTALLVIDLQAGIPTAHPFEDVVANAVRLADAFRTRKLPVVLVNVAGTAPGRTEQGGGSLRFPDDWSALLPQLNRQSSDKTVTKFTWGAFHDTDLASYLSGLGVTQVVIAGVNTSVGVESTARQAYEQGLHVTLAIDAMTDRDPATHDNSVSRIFPRLGETGSTDDILALL